MTERLDSLLSLELDDELTPAEREELAGLLESDSSASRRRARFESIDFSLQSIGAQTVDPASDQKIDASMASIFARIERDGPAVVDELSRRRRWSPGWVPSLGLVAAAAMAVYFVVPSSVVPTWLDDSNGPSLFSSESSLTHDIGLLDDPIALAVIFELDEESEAVALIDSVSAADFEIIEQLELFEYLATREEEGRG